MPGKPQAQPDLLTAIHLDAGVPPAHPRRPIKNQLDLVLQKLAFLFDRLDEALGRPSIRPEQRLKARARSGDLAKRSFAEVYELSPQEGSTRDEHFTAGGTQIQSWASLKSFARKDGADAARMAHGKKAKRCCGGHILVENRNGLCAEFTPHDPGAELEHVGSKTARRTSPARTT